MMLQPENPGKTEPVLYEEVIRIIHLHIFCITDGVSDTETL